MREHLQQSALRNELCLGISRILNVPGERPRRHNVACFVPEEATENIPINVNYVSKRYVKLIQFYL